MTEPRKFYPRPNARGIAISPEKITELRRAKLWTLAELAEQAGVSADTVRKWESGERRPNSRELAVKLARALGVPLATILAR